MTKARDLADLISAGNPLADGAISVSEISDLTATAAEINQLDNTADLPDIRPSLLLDFANSKTLDPRITFTRGSTATYWDGKTTAKAEENLLKYSQQYNVSPWQSSYVSVTADNVSAPDGTTTADKLEVNNAGNYRGIQQKVTSTSSTTYTATAYLKAGNHNYFGIQVQNQNNNSYVSQLARLYIDLTDGSSLAVGSVGTTSVTDVGNGWYKLTLTGTTPASGSNQVSFWFEFCDSNGLNNPSPAVPVGSYVYAWGAQVEQRSSATAYTATTDSPIVKYQPVLQTAASGEARFDHDPVTGESKGLLIEEARTNLVTYSEDFTNAAWAKTRSTIDSNISISPDGTITADKLVASTDNNNHRADFPYTASATTTYTFSVFAKAGEYTGVSLSPDQTSNTADDSAYFDLSSGTVTEGVNLDASSITDVGNGWFLCSATITTGASPANRALIGVLQDGSTSSYTGDGYSGIYVWGAQLEQGSFPTSYIPTSGSTVTRAKDDAVMSGSNFTDWYTGPPLSVYGEYTLLAEGSPSQRLFSLDDGGYANRVLGVVAASNGYGPYMEVFHNNVNTFTGSVATGVANTPSSLQKLVGAFDTDDFATSRNGGTVGVDTSGTIPPTLNQLRIGSMANAALHMSGAIKKLAFYPKRLPNATLQAMTEE